MSWSAAVSSSSAPDASACATSPARRATSTTGSRRRARPIRPSSARAASSPVSASPPAPVGLVEERLAGLWRHPEVARAVVGRARADDVAAQPPHVPELAVALGRDPPVRADELAAATRDLVLHDVPLTLRAEQLQLVDPGDPGIHERLGERGRPVLERVGPGPHPGEVTELEAQVDHRAVDVARPLRWHDARDDRDEGLVEVAEPLGRAAAPHLGHAPDDEPERLERRVVEGPGHLGQHASRLRGRRRVVLEVVGEAGVEVDQVAVHRRRREVAQDPPGPVEPRLADDDVALGGPGEAELEGTGGGTELVPRGDPGAVDLFAHLEEARGVAEPPAAAPEEVEVVGVQRLTRLGPLEQVVGRAPVTARERVASGRDPDRTHGASCAEGTPGANAPGRPPWGGLRRPAATPGAWARARDGRSRSCGPPPPRRGTRAGRGRGSPASQGARTPRPSGRPGR